MTFHYPHLAQCSQNSQTSEGQVSSNTHFLTKACPAPDAISQHTHRQEKTNNYLTCTVCHCLHTYQNPPIKCRLHFKDDVLIMLIHN